MASHAQIENYDDYGTVEDDREENPLERLRENLTADTIINVGMTLSQRSTEKIRWHSDAWSTIFSDAVTTFVKWQPPLREPLFTYLRILADYPPEHMLKWLRSCGNHRNNHICENFPILTNGSVIHTTVGLEMSSKWSTNIPPPKSGE